MREICSAAGEKDRMDSPFTEYFYRMIFLMIKPSAEHDGSERTAKTRLTCGVKTGWCSRRHAAPVGSQHSAVAVERSPSFQQFAHCTTFNYVTGRRAHATFNQFPSILFRLSALRASAASTRCRRRSGWPLLPLRKRDDRCMQPMLISLPVVLPILTSLCVLPGNSRRECTRTFPNESSKVADVFPPISSHFFFATPECGEGS